MSIWLNIGGVFVGVLLVFIILVLLPMFTRYLNRRNKRMKFLLLIPLALITYSIYTAIYPGDDFFEADFKVVTGLDFPEGGEIIFKSASFPDHFGDYVSVSVIKVNKNFASDLERQLQENGFQEGSEVTGSSELSEALAHIGNGKIDREYSIRHDEGVFLYVAFLSDAETIIVNRVSW